MPNTNDSQSKTLRELIDDAQLSQKDFAARIGCNQSLISYYINGKKTPGLDKAIAMASVLGVSLKVLARSLGYDVSQIPNDVGIAPAIPLDELKLKDNG